MQYDNLLRAIDVDNTATTKAAAAFIQLVAKIREAKTEELKALLQPGSSYL